MAMFTEADLLPLSGLQHLLFCERQWALIHVEQQWAENRLTQEGRVLHDRVHESGAENRPGIVIARGLRVRSLKLGLAGELDVCEFHQTMAEGGPAVRLGDREGWWIPFPVEYKRGRPKKEAWDEVQLCAQALCLEEMFATSISGGALYYGQNRRRTTVRFDAALRGQTEALASHMHELYAAAVTPAAVYEPKCESCSLKELCMPILTRKQAGVARYVARALRQQDDASEGAA